MFNLETKLEQLVQPVASCNYQADLSVWISEILTSPQDQMIIVDGQQIPQGIVTKIDLLSFVAKSLPTDIEPNLNLRNPNPRHPNRKDPKSLNTLIQPLTCLSPTTTVKQFLNRFSKNLIDKNYAVVNRQGKLLGLVNISELLKNYSQLHKLEDSSSNQLVSEIVTNSSVPQKCQSPHKQKNYSLPQQAIINNQTDNLQINNDGGFIDQEVRFLLYSLLNRVVLPLQIKSNDGEIYYTNPAWQKEFGSQSAQANSDTKISDKFWTILDQQNLSQSKENNSSLNRVEKYQCAQSHNFLLSPFIGGDTPLQKSLFPNWLQLNLNQSAQNSLLNNHSQRQESISSSQKWIYHELPFAIKQNSLYLDKQAKYRLILATQANLFPDKQNNNSFSQIQSNLQQLQHQFFLSIGHDLKSPLTSIIGLSSLLNEEKIGELNDNQMRYSQMIYHSGKKLITLINDFLNINRLTNQKLSIKAEEIALEDLIQNVYKQISGKLQAIAETSQNSKISPSCLDLSVTEAARTIFADHICLHQILTRLLETSFPSYPDAQCIKIAAEFWSEKWLAISIWGQSTTASSTQQAFFCQELQNDRSNFLTSEENKQFLGLCLAQQLAKFHGGDISFIAQHNHSNHFTLLLPQANSSLNPNSSRNHQENNIQHRIQNNNNLVVAFSCDTARILDWQQNFEKLGYHLLIARSYEDLIYKAVCFQPYSIVFDSSCLTSETSDLIENLAANPTTQKISLVYIDSCAENIQSLNRSFLAKIKQKCSHTVSIPINPTKLQQIFPAIKRKVTPPRKNLTVMRLAVENDNHSRENCVLDSVFENPSFCLCHHIIEADSLGQAYLLARIWKIDAIIWDGQMLENPQNHLESLAQNDLLADIPIVTLDKKNTAIANQIVNLVVFPCLLPAHERSIEKLTQVIQIAAGLH